LMIERNYANEAIAHRNQAGILRWQGSSERTLSGQRANAILWSGAANAVGTGVSAYGMYKQGGWLGNKAPSTLKRPTTGPMSRSYKLTYPG